MNRSAVRGFRSIVPRLLLCALLPAASTDTRAGSMDHSGIEGNVGGRLSARVSALPSGEHSRSRGGQTCSLPAPCTGPHRVAMCLRGGGGHGKAKRGGGGTGKGGRGGKGKAGRQRQEEAEKKNDKPAAAAHGPAGGCARDDDGTCLPGIDTPIQWSDRRGSERKEARAAASLARSASSDRAKRSLAARSAVMAHDIGGGVWGRYLSANGPTRAGLQKRSVTLDDALGTFDRYPRP